MTRGYPVSQTVAQVVHRAGHDPPPTPQGCHSRLLTTRSSAGALAGPWRGPWTGEGGGPDLSVPLSSPQVSPGVIANPFAAGVGRRNSLESVSSIDRELSPEGCGKVRAPIAAAPRPEGPRLAVPDLCPLCPQEKEPPGPTPQWGLEAMVRVRAPLPYTWGFHARPAPVPTSLSPALHPQAPRSAADSAARFGTSGLHTWRWQCRVQVTPLARSWRPGGRGFPVGPTGAHWLGAPTPGPCLLLELALRQRRARVAS